MMVLSVARKTHEEIVFDFAMPLAHIPPVTAQRSTTLLAEIATIREMGHFETYAANLAPAGQPLLLSVAGTWVPMPQLHAHYDACAALGMTTPQQIEFGVASANRCLGTLLGTAVSLARSAGATPWTFFANIGRFWSRGYTGGSMRVVRLGPKECRVDFAKNELFQRPFFRNGFRGYSHTLVGLFCTRFLVREEGPQGLGVLTSFRGQWV